MAKGFTYDFTPNGFNRIHVFDASSGKNSNSMEARFCGLTTAEKWQTNSNYGLSISTTFIPGYCLYFTNPNANQRDWRIMLVLPNKDKRTSFYQKYKRTFGYN